MLYGRNKHSIVKESSSNLKKIIKGKIKHSFSLVYSAHPILFDKLNQESFCLDGNPCSDIYQLCDLRRCAPTLSSIK